MSKKTSSLSTKPKIIYILHMRDAIESILEFSANHTKQTFISDRKTHLAILYQLAVLGEATRHLPTSFRRQYNSVPWRQTSDLRNKIIHDYFEVDLEALWGIIQHNLPSLHQQLIDLIKLEKHSLLP